jgi:hypothetical protein
MKSVIALSAIMIATVASLAAAQTGTTPSTRPLADVARAEEARRKELRKPSRVLTNSSLTPDISKGIADPPSATPSTGANATPSNTTPTAPDAPPGAAKDQAYWAGRIKTARDQLSRTQIFMDSLQTRINSLTTDFVNRDDPAQRAKIETDRQQALAELERVKKELTEQQKAITAIEDEARRAGVPSGWLRPGA